MNNDTQIRNVSIQIPENTEPGDVVSFNVDGNELEFEIPIGSKVGDVLQIQLASEESEESLEEKEEEEIVFVLPNKKELRLLQDKDCVKPQEDSSSDGTHGVIWPAGRTLVECGLLSRLPEATSILELGSGSGLVGLAYAASLPNNNDETTCPIRRLLLTDSSTSLLQTNVSRNKHILSSDVTIKIDTQVLEWSSKTQTKERFSIILGSDLLYNPSCIPDLIRTIEQYLDKESACTLVMAVRWRKPELEREFFQQSKDMLGISWSLQPTGSCFLSWEDFGNPSSESSNRYFSQTKISVGGNQLKALSDITEADVENKMSSEEYNAWERAFVQVFLGKIKQDQ